MGNKQVVEPVHEQSCMELLEELAPQVPLRSSSITCPEARALNPSNKYRHQVWGYCDKFAVGVMEPQTEAETLSWLFTRPQGGSEAGWLPNFRGLVLACMDSYDSEKRRILQGFSRSTRFALLCTAPNSNVQLLAPEIFAILRDFCK